MSSYFCVVTVCFKALGVASGLIRDNAMIASSSMDDTMRPYYGRVLKPGTISKTSTHGCWCARKTDAAQFLQADLGQDMIVKGKRQ